MVQQSVTCLCTALLAAVVLSAASGPAAAALVINGGFATTTATRSTQVTTGNVAGWATTGYSFIFLPDGMSLSGTGTAAASGSQADTAGASSGLMLWGPGNGSVNGLTTSPGGGSFIASGNGNGQSAITQTVSGLTAGLAYVLSFDWAAAQQFGYDDVTQEQWTVAFGAQSKATPTVQLAAHGFSGWMHTTMSFIATAETQTLSFLATGTPGGSAAFSLLDDVSLVAVPEPGTIGLLLAAVAATGLAATGRRRRRTPVVR